MRRTKEQIKRAEKIQAEGEARQDALAELGLTARDDVRFRRSEGGKWIQGRALYVNPDGSVCIGIRDNKRAGLASINPENIQKKEVGPRGGTVWEPLQG